MKKRLFTYLIISSFVLSPALRADPTPSSGVPIPPLSQVVPQQSNDANSTLPLATPQYSDNATIPTPPPATPQQPTGENTPPPSQQSTNTTPLATDPLSESESEQEGTPVGAAPQEGKRAAKRKQWQNIAIAVSAVVVAVVALVLVATNNGHKKK